jgi:hypothetical protein
MDKEISTLISKMNKNKISQTQESLKDLLTGKNKITTRELITESMLGAKSIFADECHRRLEFYWS